MGVKSYYQEIRVKVSATRLFKAVVTESHDVLPKVTPGINNIEIIQGNGIVPGCVYQTNFPQGSIKHRIDEVDPVNLVCKATTFEGNALGGKHAKICYEMKFEPTADGGCVVKVKTEYHTMADEVSDDEIKAHKEQSAGLYKAFNHRLPASTARAPHPKLFKLLRSLLIKLLFLIRA